MKAKLKRIHSPDVLNLNNAKLEGKFCFLIQMLIGPFDSEGEESFDAIICSPDWVKDFCKEKPLIGNHYFFMNTFDYAKFCELISNFCENLDEPDWNGLAHKLSVIGNWEFEAYQENP